MNKGSKIRKLKSFKKDSVMCRFIFKNEFLESFLSKEKLKYLYITAKLNHYRK